MHRPPEGLFRPGLLDGVVIAVAGEAGAGAGAAIARATARLGGTVAVLGADPIDDADVEHVPLADPLDDEAIGAAIGALADRHGRLDVLVDDAAARAAATGTGPAAPDGDGDLPGFRAALDGAWLLARAAGTRAMIEADDGGKLIALAPPAREDPERAAMRAGLENMARTLSIEWARYGIRTTCVLPAGRTAGDDLAALVAYLASPAGDYFSGCVLELGAAAGAPA